MLPQTVKVSFLALGLGFSQGACSSDTPSSNSSSGGEAGSAGGNGSGGRGEAGGLVGGGAHSTGGSGGTGASAADGGAHTTSSGGAGAGTIGDGGSMVVIPEACGEPGAHLVTTTTVQLPARGMALSFSPDGSQIAASGIWVVPPGPSKPRYDVKLYDTSTGAFIKEFGCPGYWTSAVSWEQNPTLGSVIASGNYGHRVELWDSTGPGTTVCSKTDTPFRTEDGGIEALDQINGATTWLSFSPDGRFLAHANRDPSVRVWQLEPGTNQFKVLHYWYESLSANFTSVAWSPTGKRIAGTIRQENTGYLLVWAFDEATDLWGQTTIDAFDKLDKESQEGWAHADENVPFTKITPLWKIPDREFWTTDFSPDGHRVAAVSADGKLSVFATEGGTELFSFSPPENSGLFALDYSPTGEFIAVGAKDGNIYLLDASTGQLADTLVGHHAQLTAVTWSKDGCALASTAGGPRICGGKGPTTCHQCTGTDGICPQWSDDLDVRIWRFTK